VNGRKKVGAELDGVQEPGGVQEVEVEVDAGPEVNTVQELELDNGPEVDIEVEVDDGRR